jgi:hypothetical protein
MDVLKKPAKPNRALELVPLERAGDLGLFYCNSAAVSSSFVDADPGLVGSASFNRIRIGIISKQMYFSPFSRKFKYDIQNT